MTQQNDTSPDPVLAYAQAVVSGTELAGPHVRAACRRHLDDLEHGEARGLWWDLAAAEHVFGFYRDVLRLTGGEHEGRTFELHPAQKFIVGSLFGWKKEDKRRFSTAYVEMAKGQGKSPLAAGIGLYMLTASKEARAEVYSAAVDKDQAKILFRDAVAMVEQSPALSRRMTKSGGKDGDVTKVWNLAFLETGSFFRPISSESSGRGKSGFRPYCVLLDEVHEHPTDAMVEFTRKNMKGRANALTLMITNSGIIDAGSVCWRYHQYAEKVVNGQLDDSFFAYVCGLDVGDDWKDQCVWKKAAPLLGVSVPAAYYAEEVQKSIGMPGLQSLTRRLNFCEWMDSASPFVAPEVWNENGGSVPDSELVGRPCYGGLDLSGKNDLTALALVFPMDDGTTAVRMFFWTPKATLRQRQDRDHAPYGLWVEQGHISATPGSAILYDYVAQEMAVILAKYNVQSIAFDRYRIDDLIHEMDKIGVNVSLKEHGQGIRDMTPAIECLEDNLLERRLRHGNNPVLRSCVSNAMITPDPAGGRKFDKIKSTGRIDGIVALAMALRLSSSVAEESPSYAVTII